MNRHIMEAMGFKKEVQLVKDGKCPLCQRLMATEVFRDTVSIREFGISGLCQKCQDDTFQEGA